MLAINLLGDIEFTRVWNQSLNFLFDTSLMNIGYLLINDCNFLCKKEEVNTSFVLE